MSPRNDIVLLDPALQDHEGNPSTNLGDLIISESNLAVLNYLFPGKEIIRLSSHSFLEKKHRDMINQSRYCFVGGTNILGSDMMTWRLLQLRKGRLLWLFPGVNNLILMSGGWGQGYGLPITFKTKELYKRILHKEILHSVRDLYTENKLLTETKVKAIHTSCASAWRLNGLETNLHKTESDCLFTITDYAKNEEEDNSFIEQLIASFQRLYFFPQGAMDTEYLHSLPVYKNNREKFAELPRSYTEYKAFVKSQSFVYIGTRLHGGILCLDHQHPALILGTDNRAKEMAKSIYLPVISRNDTASLARWLNREKLFEHNIELPLNNIKTWKEQFKNLTA